MDYNEFINHITSLLEDKFRGKGTIECHKILKNNSVYLDALTLLSDNSDISSTIYLNGYYTELQNGRTIPDIFNEIAGILGDNVISGFDTGFLYSFDSIKSRIAIKLINYESNLTLLDSVPYRRFLDLAAVFYIILNEPPFNNASILIQNSYLKLWNITRDDLYPIALQNTISLLGYNIMDMNAVIRELMGNGTAKPKELSSCPDISDDITKGSMFVLTNNERFFGASCILYSHVLEEFASHFHSDIYILPSSIHEVILIPSYKSPSKAELCTMVYEINRTEVSATDRLSDNVYTYSYSDKKIYV